MSSTITTTNQLNLIEGRFTEEEAKEILISMYTTKIKFNELKNFSSLIKTGKEDEFSKKRVEILNEELQKIHEILKEAQILNKKLIIKSEINISME